MKTAVLYINGLGNGQIRWRERVMQRHWQKAGVDLICAQVNWYDGKNLKNKLRQIDGKLDPLIKKYEKVILLGTSAGGSLALNTFVKHRNKKLYCVNAHGRLARGNIRWPDYRNLGWAAHLKNGQKSSKAFYDSVALCEDKSISKLKKENLKRILILKPWIDFIVPLKTMNVKGAATTMTILPGHKAAGLSHLIFCRDLILAFANK
jgi:pimeloyl-ACP methyl ester carboxylesterase